MSFREELHARARALRRTVVLAEGWDPRVREAASGIERMGLATVRLLEGPVSEHPRLRDVAALLAQRRPERAENPDAALALARDPIRFAAGLVALGEADAAVAGATCPTADVVRAALWAIGLAPETDLVSSSFYMAFDETEAPFSRSAALPESRVLTFTDAGVVPDPTAEEMAQIAASAADDRRRVVGDEPVVAFLSYSTKGSAAGARVDKVREAHRRFQARHPAVASDGELQGDAALVPEVATRKAAGSAAAGRANVLVFPDLDSGNIAYKLVQRLGGAVAIGPILQGLARPMSDLSRGATTADIVDVSAVAILQSASAAEPVVQGVG